MNTFQEKDFYQHQLVALKKSFHPIHYYFCLILSLNLPLKSQKDLIFQMQEGIHSLHQGIEL